MIFTCDLRPLEVTDEEQQGNIKVESNQKKSI